ncbi:MAG: hypothetical protein ACI4K5_04515 [Ruminococcus sp.]
MNIIELVKNILLKFPKIGEICNDIHVDFTDDIPTNYGISSTGDTLIKADILGNQSRKHTFILYAVYQSQSDYDRMANSGTLLELQYYLENNALNQKFSDGFLTKLTCSNGMLYEIPDSLNDGILYQLQITAEYEIESEDF